MWIRSALVTGSLVTGLSALAACSGGGGGGALPATSNPAVTSSTAPIAMTTSTPAATATPSAAPTATVSPNNTTSVSGVVVDLPYDGTATNPGYSVTSTGAAAVPGAPISGALVYVGPTIVSGASAPSTVPAGFAHAVTDANGAFSISNLRPGHVAITIFAATPHVTVVHQDLVVAAHPAASAAYYMTTPSATESAWFAQENFDRSLFLAPPTILDESVVEAGRYWAQFMQTNHYFEHCIPASNCVAGDTTPPPPSYGPQDVDPQHRMLYFHGYSSASEGENIAAGFPTWQSVDAAFMAEQSACPNSSPVDCTFSAATGHFLNIVDTRYVWTGFGVSALPGSGPYYDQEFALLESIAPSTSARRGQRLAR